MPISFLNDGPQQPDNNLNLAIEIMKAKFPDVLQRLQNTVFATGPSKLDFAVNGEYNHDTKEIAVKTGTREFNTNNTIKMLQTLLHELNHAEDATPAAQKTRYGPFGDPKQGREFVGNRVGDYSKENSTKRDNMIKRAESLGFPSVDSKSLGGENELIATLLANSMMRERGINGPYAEQSKEMEQDPEVANWVARNKYPQVPSFSPVQPTVMEKLFNGLGIK